MARTFGLFVNKRTNLELKIASGSDDLSTSYNCLNGNTEQVFPEVSNGVLQHRTRKLELVTGLADGLCTFGKPKLIDPR